MKKRHFGIIALLVLGCLVCIFPLYSQTIAEPPSNFDEPNAGTEENPFLISNLANLRWLSETPEYWGSGSRLPQSEGGGYAVYQRYHYLQTADIDASEDPPIDFVFRSIGLPYGADSSGSIGFYGSYNGNNYKIDNLHLYMGLFYRVIHSTLQNINLTNVRVPEVTTLYGTLVNYLGYSEVLNCTTTHSRSTFIVNDWTGRPEMIRAPSFVGSSSNSHIEFCFSDSGFMREWFNSTIKNSYVHVSPRDWFHGVVSNNSSYLDNLLNFDQFNTVVTTTNRNIIVENVYMTSIAPIEDGIALSASMSQIVADNVSSFLWDAEATGIEIGAWVYEELGTNYPYFAEFGLTTREMKRASTYINAGWDFEDVWAINPLFNNGYPFLRIQHPDITHLPIDVEPPMNIHYTINTYDIQLSWSTLASNNIVIGYRIYRDGESLIGDGLLDETQFFDTVNKEGEYRYEITAIYEYEIESVPLSIMIVVDPVAEDDRTVNFLLSSSVYPNPVSGNDLTFKIRSFAPDLSQNSTYIDIYNIKGQLVKRSNEFQNKDGEFIFVWDKKDSSGREVGSGVYFYRFTPPPTPSINRGGNMGGMNGGGNMGGMNGGKNVGKFIIMK